MDFEVTQEESPNSPIPKEKLSDLIQSTYENLEQDNKLSVEQLLRNLLEQLNTHSSFYKYVISITTLETGSGDANNEDRTMSNSVGASWNPRKDGLFNYELRGCKERGTNYLVTVIWVAK